MKSVDGATARERVKVKPSAGDSFGYRVEVGGTVVRVGKVGVMRDGGTTTLYLETGRQIVFPSPFRRDDTTPTLDGECIEVAP